MAKTATTWKPRSGTGDVSTATAENLITISGEELVTIGGENLVTTETVITPKDDTVWELETKNTTAWKPRSGTGSVSTLSGVERTTEAGETRITEASETRVLEDTVITPKDDTVWEE